MSPSRYLVFILAAACANDVSLGGPNTLVRVDPELDGSNCTQGGVAIHTGLDDDGDRFLDDEEVDSTQYVCNGESFVQCAGGKILSGTVTVRDAAGFEPLENANCVDGDLLITGVENTTLPRLASLEIVTGDIVIAGNANLTSLDGLSAVTQIGRNYLIQGNDSLADLRALGNLKRVSGISINANDALIDLAGLEPFVDIATTLTISNNGSLERLTGLDNLTASSRTITIRNNRNLTSVAGLDQLRSTSLLEISGNAQLPAIALASLEKVDGRILFNTNAGLTSVDLPALTAVGDFARFDGNGALATINVPSLLTAGGLFVTNNPAVTSVNAPSLLFVTGNVELTIVPRLINIGFGELTSIGGTFSLFQAAMLPDLSGMAQLSSIGNAMSINSSGITGFAMPALGVVSGNMQIQNNPRLSSFTGLPVMTEVGQDLTISGNPMLPVAASQAFAARITVRGRTTINP